MGIRISLWGSTPAYKELKEFVYSLEAINNLAKVSSGYNGVTTTKEGPKFMKVLSENKAINIKKINDMKNFELRDKTIEKGFKECLIELSNTMSKISSDNLEDAQLFKILKRSIVNFLNFFGKNQKSLKKIQYELIDLAA